MDEPWRPPVVTRGTTEAQGAFPFVDTIYYDWRWLFFYIVEIAISFYYKTLLFILDLHT